MSEINIVTMEELSVPLISSPTSNNHKSISNHEFDIEGSTEKSKFTLIYKPKEL